MMTTQCSCMQDMRDDYPYCPFYLECLYAEGWISYSRLLRDDTGKVTGHVSIHERHHGQ